MDSLDRQIRYFLKIADLRSLSKAAEALDVAQSGLSRQITALEAYVGKPLFVRTGRGVALTEAGRQLKEHVEPAYLAIDAALEAARVVGVTRGTVKLACVHTLSYYFMADVVARFISQYDGANLSIMGRSSPEVVSLVESGKADVGFVYDAAVASQTLVSTPLFDDEMCLIVPRDSDIGNEIDLTRNRPRLVGFPPHYALRRMVHSSGLNPQFVAEAETVDAVLNLVASGVGACILPLRIPDKVFAESHLRKVTITKPMLRRRVVVIVRSDKTPSPLVRSLIDTALAAVG
jgi:DNA-binding transcriptional LysR family regulator